MTSTAAIDVRALDLAVRGRVLLERASFRVEEGELVLLVGLSGTGKSLTLRLILDLLDRQNRVFAIGGEILLYGEKAEDCARQRAGIVFQDFGLFDEFDARQNLAFGFDHRRVESDKGREATINRLVEDFDLGSAGRIAEASGGMKQRCALARTLAYDPDLLVYDEPTSGLDPAMSEEVAARIRRTTKDYGKTSLVVTHDLTALADVADRIILLDPEKKCFREIRSEEVDAALAELRHGPKNDDKTSEDDSRSLPQHLHHFVGATGRALWAIPQTAFGLIPRWPKVNWGLRYLWYYFRLSALGSALAYVAIAGFILGLIVTYFSFSFLPFKQYTEPLLIDRVIGAIGYALYRIMVPGMVAMLVAARSGAAIAADIGHRVYSRQTDALRSFGVEPARYLTTNALLAHLFGMPLLIAVNWIFARAASLLVFVLIHPEHSTFFWASEFDRYLDFEQVFSEGTLWVLGKSIISGLGVAALAAREGLRPKSSGRDVAQGVTRTIIAATLFVLLIQLISALLEFDPI